MSSQQRTTAQAAFNPLSDRFLLKSANQAKQKEKNSTLGIPGE